jgi:formylglycine-generating enzyme required for sulfatase activity
MKKFAAAWMCLALANAQAATIEQVIVRQQWPWSTDIKVEYKISGVEKTADLVVTAFNGNEPLDSSLLDSAISGPRLGIKDGIGEFTIDPVKAFGTDKVALANFKVKLSAVETSESMSKALYKIVDLQTGKIKDVTAAELLGGTYGAVETGGQTIVPGGEVDETKIYWTGVTNNDEYATTSLVLRRIPSKGKTFQMGARSGEQGSGYAYKNMPRGKETQHNVTLTKDYYIGVYELTQKQYNLLTGAWPSKFNNATYRDTRPVEKVSWDAITGTFLPALNELTSKSFVLPTEAQWEFAYRAGTITGLHNGKDVLWEMRNNGGVDDNLAPIARYFKNAGASNPGETVDTSRGSAKVGSYQCNNWGLYDMAGNVKGWCSDYFQDDLGSEDATDPTGPETGTYRTVRNGHWGYAQNANGTCRAAFRLYRASSGQDEYNGFRVALAAE